VDALGQIQQGIAHRESKVLLFESGSKFAGERFRAFRGNHFKSGGESVSRTDGSTEEVQRFGEVFLKFPKSALILRPVKWQLMCLNICKSLERAVTAWLGD
jgi:hypothetical protein